MSDKIKVIKVIRSIEIDEMDITKRECPHCQKTIKGSLSLRISKDIADALDNEGLLKQ